MNLPKFPIPAETAEDVALEAQIRIAVELGEVAASDEEYDSAAHAVATLVKQRSPGAALRNELEWQRMGAKADR